MNAGLIGARIGAEWLVRLEIIVLTGVYVYFVLSDLVPPIAFGVLALIWLARWWLRGTPTIASPLILPILILIAGTFVSATVSIQAWTSAPKVYGVILGAAFFFATLNAIQSRRDRAWAAFWLMSVCAAMAFAGLIGTDWAQGKIVSATFIYDRLPRFVQGIPRSIAGGFARNGVGGTLTFIVPLLAALVVYKAQARTRKPERRENNPATEHWILKTAFLPILIISFFLALVTLALTQSRGGILGVGVGLLAVVIWRERRFAWLIAIGAIILFGVVALGYGNALAEFVLKMDARNGTLASRLEVWQRGVMMVRDFPFTGIGIGTYNAIAHLQYPFFIASPDEVVAHAHNQLLEVAVDVGIPGLIAYSALLVGFAISAARVYRTTQDASVRALTVGLASGMLAFHVFGLTDAFILGSKPGILMWVFFGFVAALDARRMTGDA